MQGKGRGKDDGSNSNRWGGYMEAKVSKLQDQFRSEAQFSNCKGIFNGVAIFVNGYTDPPAAELKRIMMEHGGTYHHYKLKTTTHTIASNLCNAKMRHSNTDYIVTPEWITDSLAAKKLLDYRKYLLVKKEGASQPKITFKSSDLTIISKEPEHSGPSNYCNKAPLDIQPISTELNYSSDDASLTEEINSDSVRGEVVLSSKASSMNTSNPNFLSDFYSNSRLHHISTAGNMFKEYVRKLRGQVTDFTGRKYLKEWLIGNASSTNPKTDVSSSLASQRIIMHIDMDCFFVSVGLIKYPNYRGKPVAVTHATKDSAWNRDESNSRRVCDSSMQPGGLGSGNPSSTGGHLDDNNQSSADKLASSTTGSKCSMAEIASCSYEAREKGIKNGMFLGAALRLCPELLTIPYDFEGYKSVSQVLYDTVASYTHNVKAVSCDEMFVDLTGVLEECVATPLQFASCIRQQIREKTGCPCSVGLGPNVAVARMATKKAKPDGQFHLPASEVVRFMQDQDLDVLPGVGRVMKQRLVDEGVDSCRELQKVSLSRLQCLFGLRTGKSLYDLCRGVDDRPFNEEHERKSVSAEVNYGIRFKDWDDAEKFTKELSGEVSRRLRSASVEGKTLTLKIKVRSEGAPVESVKFMGHGMCDDVSKSVGFLSATSNEKVIFKESFSLMKKMTKKPEDLRGIGIKVTKLESATQQSSSSSIKTFLAQPPPPRPPVGGGGGEERSAILDASLPATIKQNSSDEKSHVKKTKNSNSLKDYFAKTKSWDTISRKKCTSGKNTVACGDHKFSTGSKIDFDSRSSSDDQPRKVLDAEVLESLPEDLRSQVLEEYIEDGYVLPSTVTESGGPSLVPSGDEVDPKTSNENYDEKNVDDLSFSQIDASFLNALPVEVRLDVLSDLKKRKIERKTAQSSQYGSPKKSKRGRPIGSKQKRVYSDCPSTKSPKSSSMKQTELDRQDNQSQSEEKADEKSKGERPNLCGETELTSIKALISKWVLTSEKPAKVDVEIIRDFCVSLVTGRDLERLELVGACLHRRTMNRSMEWQKGFADIVSAIQEKMMEVYGSPISFQFLRK